MLWLVGKGLRLDWGGSKASQDTRHSIYTPYNPPALLCRRSAACVLCTTFCAHNPPFHQSWKAAQVHLELHSCEFVVPNWLQRPRSMKAGREKPSWICRRHFGGGSAAVARVWSLREAGSLEIEEWPPAKPEKPDCSGWHNRFVHIWLSWTVEGCSDSFQGFG